MSNYLLVLRAVFLTLCAINWSGTARRLVQGAFRVKRQAGSDNTSNDRACLLTCFVDFSHATKDVDPMRASLGGQGKLQTPFYDEEVIEDVCAAFRTLKECMSECGVSETAVSPAVRYLTGPLNYMCVQQFDTLRSVLPCYRDTNASVTRECETSCDGAESLSQALDLLPTRYRRALAAAAKGGVNSKERAEMDKQTLTIFLSVCSYVQCTLECQAPIYEAQCKSAAPALFAKGFFEAFFKNAVELLPHLPLREELADQCPLVTRTDSLDRNIKSTVNRIDVHKQLEAAQLEQLKLAPESGDDKDTQVPFEEKEVEKSAAESAAESAPGQVEIDAGNATASFVTETPELAENTTGLEHLSPDEAPAIVTEGSIAETTQEPESTTQPQQAEITEDSLPELLETTEQPAELEAITSETVIDTSENITDTSENIIDAPENIIDTSENIIDAPENIIDTSENIIDAPENIIDTSENIIDAPENIIDTSENITDTSNPPEDLSVALTGSESGTEAESQNLVEPISDEVAETIAADGDADRPDDILSQENVESSGQKETLESSEALELRSVLEADPDTVLNEEMRPDEAGDSSAQTSGHKNDTLCGGLVSKLEQHLNELNAHVQVLKDHLKRLSESEQDSSDISQISDDIDAEIEQS